MPLAEHLHPKTYWEERAELTEQAVFQALQILLRHVSPSCAHDLQLFATEWNENLRQLTDRYPPPTAGVGDKTNG